MDTGNGEKFITNPGLEETMAMLQSGAASQSPWTDWFTAHGGGLSGDANLKLQNTIDWRGLASHLWVLDVCYAQGTCPDAVPDPGGGTTTPPVQPLPAPSNLRLVTLP